MRELSISLFARCGLDRRRAVVAAARSVAALQPWSCGYRAGGQRGRHRHGLGIELQDVKSRTRAARRLRAVLFGSTALVAVAVLATSTVLLSTPAQADGGAGGAGSAGSAGLPPEGGVGGGGGADGQPGHTGGDATFPVEFAGGGGGGGGAGGGLGGTGGTGATPGGTTAGGTAGNPGTGTTADDAGAGGGGGGNGGANGQSASQIDNAAPRAGGAVPTAGRAEALQESLLMAAAVAEVVQAVTASLSPDLRSTRTRRPSPAATAAMAEPAAQCPATLASAAMAATAAAAASESLPCRGPPH